MKNSYSTVFILLALLFTACEEEIPNYTVIVSASPAEGGSVSPQGGEYQQGQTATFTATPNEFFGFIGWSGADSSSSNPVSIIVDSNKSLTAKFEKLDTDNDGVTDDIDQCPNTPEGETADANGCSVSQKEFELTITTQGEGTVTEQVVVAPSIYQGTTQIQLTAVSAEGWELSHWFGDLSSTENPIIIEIDSNKNIGATFVKKDTDGDGVPDLEDTCANTPSDEEADENGCSLSQKDFELTITTEGEGTVTEELIVSTSMYQGTSQVKLTAVPAEGWEFTEWTGDATGSENPIIVDIDGAKNITALFTKKDTDGDGVPDLEDNCLDTPEGDRIDENGCSIPPIKLHSNGVTIVAEEWAEVGTTFELNGISYTIIDKAKLLEMLENEEDVSTVVTSKITDLSGVFENNSSFNDDISSWDTSNVTDLSDAFMRAISFNSDLSNWDVSNVIDFSRTFYEAKSFNADLSNWDVSSGESFNDMFWEAKVFNSNLNTWDVSKAETLKGMFGMANRFNSDLSAWDVSNATDISLMFYCANEECDFNGDISNWDVSSIKTMDKTFFNQKNFNQDLSNWNVDNVEVFKFAFAYTKVFNSDISNWNTKSSVDMEGMFYGSNFNQDLSSWDVSKVITMSEMFLNNVIFNQDLSSWDVSNVVECSSFLSGATSWTKGKPSFTNCDPDFEDTDGDGFIDALDDCPNTPEGDRVDENGCTIPPIKLHSNGVTIVAEEWAEVGTVYELNGKSYKIVDRDILDDMITNGEDLSSAVTTKITDFRNLFYQKTVSDSNQNIEGWDTSNVTDMYNLFNASNINPTLTYWDVRNVTTMRGIFFNSLFNGDVSMWKTESLTELKFAFGNTTVFNSDLNDWDVSKVTDMSNVFANADGFNKPLNNWDVSNVTNMTSMFSLTAIFNQDLSSWCVRFIFAEPSSFSLGNQVWDDSNKPQWGTCPDGSSSDSDSSESGSNNDTSGEISFTRFSESKACINNSCDVTLGLRFSNGTAESISVSKIEVYVNESLTITYNTGDALGTYEAGQSKSFYINFEDATTGKVIIFYTQNDVSSTQEYNWTNE